MERPGPGRLDIRPLHSGPSTLAVTTISSEQLAVCSNGYQVVKYFVLHLWMEAHILDSEVLPIQRNSPKGFLFGL